jgi:hypothetical protein
MFNIPSFFGFRANSGFDSDYQAILNYATTQGYTLPSESQRIKQNQLLLDLKAGGIWNKLDTFVVFATDGSSNFALVDWKRLSQYTAVSSPLFITNQGFQGDGLSSYLNTNFTPSINGVNYTLDNASRLAWISGTSTNTQIDGSLTQNNNLMLKVNSNNQRFNTTFTINIAADNSHDGYRLFNRLSSIDVALFSDTTLFSRLQGSQSLPSANQTILANAGNRSGNLVSFYGMGASLFSENTALRTALTNYITSL